MDLCKQFYGEEHGYFESKGCGYTAYEIAHQPQMWLNFCDVLKENEQAIRSFMSSIDPLKEMRIILTGAGSSGFVGRAVAGFVAQSSNIHCEAIHTTDIVSAPETYLFADVPTLLVSFARSGNSPESVGAVEYARKIVKNLYEVAITCDGESKLAKTTRESEKSLVFVMPEGTNDKGFAMTSSVSTMTLAGFALFNANRVEDITKDIKTLASWVEENGSALSKAAASCAEWGYERAWYLGSGAFTALMHEGALKMLELTYGAVAAGHNNSAEFRHGPKTIINPKIVTVHFISNNAFTARYDMDLLNELFGQRDGNKLVALYDQAAGDVQADLAVPYSAQGYTFAEDVAVGIQGLVFMQLLSMYTSLKLGVTTDNPSPSGLVNRVVQGVTVYPYLSEEGAK